MMKEFYSTQRFDIQGRGTIYTIELGPQDKIAMGEHIILDGEEKKIWGLEVHSRKVPGWKPKREGLREIAISVRDI